MTKCGEYPAIPSVELDAIHCLRRSLKHVCLLRLLFHSRICFGLLLIVKWVFYTSIEWFFHASKNQKTSRCKYVYVAKGVSCGCGFCDVVCLRASVGVVVWLLWAQASRVIVTGRPSGQTVSTVAFGRRHTSLYLCPYIKYLQETCK